MDRLSIAFFAAAFVIAGTAVTGIALRAGVGARVAGASVAASFGEVMAGGSTSLPAPGSSEAPPLPVTPAKGPCAVETRIAAVAAPPARKAILSGREVADPAPPCESAPGPCPDVLAALPAFEWTEERHAALARAIAKAEAGRMHVRRVRAVALRMRTRSVEHDDVKCPHEAAEERECAFEVLAPTPS